MIHIRGSEFISESLADLREGEQLGKRTPALSVQFLLFSCSFPQKKRKIIGRETPGKSWIRHRECLALMLKDSADLVSAGQFGILYMYIVPNGLRSSCRYLALIKPRRHEVTVTPTLQLISLVNLFKQQECIPVGCEPQASVAISEDGCLPREGCLPKGLSAWGVYTSPCGQNS